MVCVCYQASAAMSPRSAAAWTGSCPLDPPPIAPVGWLKGTPASVPSHSNTSTVPARCVGSSPLTFVRNNLPPPQGHVVKFCRYSS
jgi:hypothetical protein